MERNPHDLDPALRPQTINLPKGGQAVINGALVTATLACTIEVGSGAFVLTGRSLRRDPDTLRNPHEELYFSMIDAVTSDDRFHEERFRLFRLLSQVVVQDRSHEGQRQCNLCASALLAGNRDDALKCAARLAAERVSRRETMPGHRAAAIRDRARMEAPLRARSPDLAHAGDVFSRRSSR